MRRGGRAAQRGAVLILLAAVLVLGISWMLVAALGNASSRTTEQRTLNARVLAEAKTALVAWVATSALSSSEDNPGRLPCPQAWGDIGTANEGRAAANCSAPAVGWLPWRTLGLPKPLDASGQQLWYVVSPGWHLPSSGATLTINSNSPGQMTLDGQPVVALIIAPGPALNIAPNANQIAAGCVARNQSQALNLPATAPNPLDFLDCHNGSTADYVFVSSAVDNGVNRVFNDQVLAVTTSDVLPMLEGAIAKRIERDIVPAVKSVFQGPSWGLPAGARLFPYAAPFANPGPGAGTSSYAGATATYQGLLPFSQVQNCTASSSNPRCLPGSALHSWATTPTAYDAGGWGYIQTISCWYEAGNAARVCEGEYHQNDSYPNNPGMRIEMEVTLNNVAMALRTFDTSRMQVQAKNDTSSTWSTVTPGYQATMASDGSLTIRFWGDLPNIASMSWGTYANFRIRIERLVVSDHALLDPNDATYGWFVRNEWFRLLYYTAAQTHTAASLPGTPACTSNGNCLRLTTWPSTTPAWDKRALLLLAGRSLTGASRPNATLSDFVEAGNGDGGTMFEQRAVNPAFNDRVVVLDSN